jgi:4-hydroxybenzoyl-CoA thioesterase
MSADVFSIAQQIRFSHTDPAGIVYFPNYFDFANGVVEDFYTKRLGVDYAKLIFAERRATPIVHAACDFFAPSRMGETLAMTLLLDRVGQSSIAFSIFGHDAERLRLQLRIVTVYMDLDSGKSTPIPDDLRRRFAAYQLAATGWTPPPKPGAAP